MWREVEQRLDGAAPGSDEADLFTDEWARLRIEYRRLTDLARLHHRPEPEPWPATQPATEAPTPTGS